MAHVTLTTGDVRQTPRSEVSRQAIQVAADMIRRGQGPDMVPMGIGPYSLSCRADGRCLVATVWTDGPPSVVICTIGVALHSRCGAVVWQALHDYGTAPVVTDRDHQPPTPWVAAALEGAALTDPAHREALTWLGDFARCLAWAWHEMRTA